jgi:hypothetical protein
MNVIEEAMRKAQSNQHGKTKRLDSAPASAPKTAKPAWRQLLAVGVVSFALGATMMKIVLEPAKAVPLASQQAQDLAAPIAAAKPANPGPTPLPANQSKQEEALRKEVLAAVDAWVKAWSSKDTETYISAYSQDFQPAKNISHAKWVEQRRSRISKYGKVDIKLSDITVHTLGNSAIVEFVQDFKNNAFIETGVRKHLELVKFGAQWKIVSESVFKN